MHDRSALGPADVSDLELTRMVAGLLGHDPADVDLVSSSTSPVAYDVPALTTVSRHCVHGTARTPRGTEEYRLFVKHVQARHHSAFFAQVPEPARAMAAAGVPWRIEPRVYRSRLREALPAGLTMPRALAVVDLEPDAAAVWLEPVVAADEVVTWDLRRHERAAYLLGRLAASPDVEPLGDVGGFDWTVQHYAHGRLAVQVLPVLASDEVWEHPVVAAAFGRELREDLRQAGLRVTQMAEELAALPLLRAHGDAAPNNLLPGPTPDSFVLIDFGFWLPQPVGFDLGQLVAGEAQLGRGPDEPLGVVDDTCLAAYTRGLGEEGVRIDRAVVRRGHALQLLLFAGLSAVPLELLDRPPTPELVALARRRAELARLSLDLVASTGGPGRG